MSAGPSIAKCLPGADLTHERSHAVKLVSNSLVEVAKARARGYLRPEDFITVISLIAGKSDLRLSHTK